MRTRDWVVACAAWLLFVVSLFLPTVVTIDLGDLGVWNTNLRGWHATLVAFGAVSDIKRDPFGAVTAFMGALCNLFMLYSPYVLLWSRRPQTRAIPLLGLFATLVTISVFMGWHDMAHFGPGYYVWVLSFALLTGSLFMVDGRGHVRTSSKSQQPHNYRIWTPPAIGSKAV
jgi:hypothetical protein